MFKWKVSGLGGGGKKAKQQQQAAEKAAASEKLNNGVSATEQIKNNKNKEPIPGPNHSLKKGDSTLKREKEDNHPSKSRFPFFSSSSNNALNGPGNNSSQNNGPVTNGNAQGAPSGTMPNSNNAAKRPFDNATLSRVGQRLAMAPGPQMPPPPNMGNGPPPNQPRLPLEPQSLAQRPMMGPPGPPGMSSATSTFRPQFGGHPMYRGTLNGSGQPNHNHVEDALPSDSLYRPHQSAPNPRTTPHGPPESGEGRSGMGAMAHWSSHGYLAKPNSNGQPSEDSPLNHTIDNGYVTLKRQGEQLVTATQNGRDSHQPQSLPTARPPVHGPNGAEPNSSEMTDRKYFSVRGMSDLQSKLAATISTESDASKYYSVDARYHATMKNFAPLELRSKAGQSQPKSAPNPYQASPPVPPPRNPGQPVVTPNRPNSLEQSKQMSSSVSWLEWTQQLQAYIAWVNSQLRKRPDLKPVQDLRTDLQTGEVLAQLIEIISGEEIAGIQYNPESLQGMRENLERILQFMANKRIRMHQISSKEILEGNLKAVMRLILALAAHYKPQSVRHHDQQPLSQPSTTTANQSTLNLVKAPHPTGHPGENIADRHSSRDVLKTSALDESFSRSNETTHSLNHTQESMSGLDTSANATIVVKRAPSMNDSHYSRSARMDRSEPTQIYENVSPSTVNSVVRESMSTQTDARSPLRPLQRESSFVRTGSGRKLPKIPAKPTSTGSTPTPVIIHGTHSLPRPRKNEDYSLDDMEPEQIMSEATKAENRKSRPKALDFWESMTTMDSVEGHSKSDFRYNTIHRMSVGRRILPQTPPGKSMSHPQRSQSLDRSGDIAAAIAATQAYSDADKSLNSSFSGPTSMSNSASRTQSPAHRPPLESSTKSAQVIRGQPSPSSSDTRGEVEGSSDNNSPPTSVIQGVDLQWNKERALEWLNKSSLDIPGPTSKWDTTGMSKEYLSHQEELNSEKFHPKYAPSHGNGFASLNDEVLAMRSLRAGDGNSQSSGKHSDSLSDAGMNGGGLLDGIPPHMGHPTPEAKHHIPYEVLHRDLNQAKRQLLDLHSLECSNLESAKQSLEAQLSSKEANVDQIRETLLRTSLAKQSLEAEKKELLKRVHKLESSMMRSSSSSIMDPPTTASSANLAKLQLEEFIEKSKRLGGDLASLSSENGIINSEIKALYEEEVTVAKDAIANLRTSFNNSDPNQHILDTLEQCISVIIEKIQTKDVPDPDLSSKGPNTTSSSRMSSLDYHRINDGGNTSQQSNATSASGSLISASSTKVLYFTNRSVTPFMTTIQRRIGEVTLRDFKNIFDRPGFYRFHFKAVDLEFGMVKEEITLDDSILPGSEGKIVAWVEEE